jgi:hypothetical protein
MNDEEVIVAEEGVQPEPSDPFDVADSWNSAKRTDGPDNMEVDSSDEDEDEDEGEGEELSACDKTCAPRA